MGSELGTDIAERHRPTKHRLLIARVGIANDITQSLELIGHHITGDVDCCTQFGILDDSSRLGVDGWNEIIFSGRIGGQEHTI